MMFIVKPQLKIIRCIVPVTRVTSRYAHCQACKPSNVSHFEDSHVSQTLAFYLNEASVFKHTRSSQSLIVEVVSVRFVVVSPSFN